MEEYRTTGFSSVDRFVHARQSRFNLGISPVALTLAFMDWTLNLANSPGKQLQLIDKFFLKSKRFSVYAMQAFKDPDCLLCEEPIPQDNRFKGPEWQTWPFNIYSQAFLLVQRWWQSATTVVPGVSTHNQDVVSFLTRQFLDIFAPSNFILTNPVIARLTAMQGGSNLMQGWTNFVEDWQRVMTGKRPVGVENFQVGKHVAITPGKVVFRNRLIELIQYSPTTEQVYAEPVLIIPAWIMKYYILDLSPHNSLVKYLVDRGHTVFMVSWKNPTSQDRQLNMEDYRKLGIMDALEAISAIVPERKIHTVGYCLGGTLLSIAAATMTRNGDERLKSMTLLAAQTDFSEAGELMVFIDENQVNYLEDIMWDQGCLDTRQMAGAFQLLRSNDLIWSEIIYDYLLGERRPMIDLMAWNSDATRMPYRMHSEYLRSLFLNNDLAEGRYEVDGRAIAISDIRVPVFIVSTQQDHVAPWQSVYKFNLYTDAEEVTFVLTSGGHNAGIVSEPEHIHRSFQINTHKQGDRYIDPDIWRETMPEHKGSWWIPWQEWLVRHSGGQVPPPSMGAQEKGYRILLDAPGTYVLLD